MDPMTMTMLMQYLQNNSGKSDFKNGLSSLLNNGGGMPQQPAQPKTEEEKNKEKEAQESILANRTLGMMSGIPTYAAAAGDMAGMYALKEASQGNSSDSNYDLAVGSGALSGAVRGAEFGTGLFGSSPIGKIAGGLFGALGGGMLGAATNLQSVAGANESFYNRKDKELKHKMGNGVEPMIAAKGGFAIGDDMIPVQMEKGEVFLSPDLGIFDTKATKQHKDMNRKEITDVIKQGSFVFSNQKKFKPYDIKDISLGYGVVNYSEDGGYALKKMTMADVLGDSKKDISFSDGAKKIRDSFKVIRDNDVESDLLTKVTNIENMTNRVAYLSKLIEKHENSADSDNVGDITPKLFAEGGYAIKGNIDDDVVENSTPEDREKAIKAQIKKMLQYQMERGSEKFGKPVGVPNYGYGDKKFFNPMGGGRVDIPKFKDIDEAVDFTYKTFKPVVKDYYSPVEVGQVIDFAFDNTNKNRDILYNVLTEYVKEVEDGEVNPEWYIGDLKKDYEYIKKDKTDKGTHLVFDMLFRKMPKEQRMAYFNKVRIKHYKRISNGRTPTFTDNWNNRMKNMSTDSPYDGGDFKEINEEEREKLKRDVDTYLSTPVKALTNSETTTNAQTSQPIQPAQTNSETTTNAQPAQPGQGAQEPQGEQSAQPTQVTQSAQPAQAIQVAQPAQTQQNTSSLQQQPTGADITPPYAYGSTIDSDGMAHPNGNVPNPQNYNPLTGFLDNTLEPLEGDPYIGIRFKDPYYDDKRNGFNYTDYLPIGFNKLKELAEVSNALGFPIKNLKESDPHGFTPLDKVTPIMRDKTPRATPGDSNPHGIKRDDLDGGLRDGIKATASSMDDYLSTLSSNYDEQYNKNSTDLERLQGKIRGNASMDTAVKLFGYGLQSHDVQPNLVKPRYYEEVSPAAMDRIASMNAAGVNSMYSNIAKVNPNSAAMMFPEAYDGVMKANNNLYYGYLKDTNDKREKRYEYLESIRNANNKELKDAEENTRNLINKKIAGVAGTISNYIGTSSQLSANEFSNRMALDKQYNADKMGIAGSKAGMDMMKTLKDENDKRIEALRQSTSQPQNGANAPANTTSTSSQTGKPQRASNTSTFDGQRNRSMISRYMETVGNAKYYNNNEKGFSTILNPPTNQDDVRIPNFKERFSNKLPQGIFGFYRPSEMQPNAINDISYPSDEINIGNFPSLTDFRLKRNKR